MTTNPADLTDEELDLKMNEAEFIRLGYAANQSEWPPVHRNELRTLIRMARRARSAEQEVKDHEDGCQHNKAYLLLMKSLKHFYCPTLVEATERIIAERDELTKRVGELEKENAELKARTQ